MGFLFSFFYGAFFIFVQQVAFAGPQDCPECFKIAHPTGQEAQVTSLHHVSQSVHSQTVLKQMRSFGAECSDLPQGGAFRCTFPPHSFAGYPKRVTAVIPAQLESVDRLHLHLHGWLVGNPPSHDREVLNLFPFEKNFVKGAETKDSILFIPESEGRCDTFNSFFPQPKNSNRFLGKMREFLSSSRPDAGAISLSAHSGGQWSVGYLAAQARDSKNAAHQISSISLLDASYEQSPVHPSLQHVSDWVNADSGRRLQVYYVPQTPTQTGADRIQKWTQSSKDRVIVQGYMPAPGGWGPHYQIMMDCHADAWKNRACKKK